MADMDNFAEINENFDTVKTLLNSIRAQGILNTSDVDKLLSGINTKLEKINTEEDIDLIKIFLSELKQTLDERHGVLVSKFGAIESLFANLLKNSSEMTKSSEIKELFDIVATNLSVFSREVVSQKETLTDITLRIDALRSDDSLKKDIIKNIALLKPDLERLNNGFDSIVVSLNENFKTIVKTITSIDKTEYLDKFSEALNNIESSSNTVLSALQMLDKKTERVENVLLDLANKEDLNQTNKKILELTAQNIDLTNAVTDLSEKHLKLDNLSEKIDASVNIIASLKSVLEENDDNNTRAIIEELAKLESELVKITNDSSFADFKLSLEILLSSLTETVSKIDKEVLLGVEDSLKKLAELEDENFSKVLKNITNNAEILNTKISDAKSNISSLFERNFTSIFDALTALKTVVSQIDDNSISANNAIFSNITDRLSIFETNLNNALEQQEKTVYESTSDFSEKFSELKNLASVLDYKVDSSVVNIGNVKVEIANLKDSIDEVLALDFVNSVNDFRIDLYAAKQEMVNAVETSGADLADKFTNDLYGKYELLISKLDSVEEEFKKVQYNSLSGIKGALDNISSSIVDVISYVSEQKTLSFDSLDNKFIAVTNAVKENSLNYIESVRDTVEIIRVQVDNNIKNLEEDILQNFESLKGIVTDNHQDLKNDIKYSYSKLLEIQDAYKQILSTLDAKSDSDKGSFDDVILSTNSLKDEVETKFLGLKSLLLEKITEFKREISLENLDKISEIKFALENNSSKVADDFSEFTRENANNFEEIKNALENNSLKLVNEFSEFVEANKRTLDKFEENNSSDRAVSLAKIIENFETLKELIKLSDEHKSDELALKVDLILNDFSSLKTILEKVDENVDGDMTRQLSIIESNFESLISQINILFEKSDLSLANKIEAKFTHVSDEMQETLNSKLELYKSKIEETFEVLGKKTIEQSNYLQDRIVALNSVMKEALSEQAKENLEQIQSLSETLKLLIEDNIKLTTLDYEKLIENLDNLSSNITSNNEALVDGLKAQFEELLSSTKAIEDSQAIGFKTITTGMNSNLSQVKDEFSSVAQLISKNESLIVGLGETVVSEADTIKKDVSQTAQETKAKVDELSETLTSEMNLVKSELAQSVLNTQAKVAELSDIVNEKINIFKSFSAEASASEIQVLDVYVNQLLEEINLTKQVVESCKELTVEVFKKDLELISTNIEKETDVVIAELIEQFELLKKSQQDDVLNIVNRVEEIVNSQVYNNIEDLKSYLDIKTDNSILVSKLDNFKIEITASISSILSDLTKLLGTEVFTSAVTDFRFANEVLVNSAVDKINDKIDNFVNDNNQILAGLLLENSKLFEDKLAIFDKKFVEIIVDKFEEIKLISNNCSASFVELRQDILGIISNFNGVRDDIDSKIEALKDQIEVNNSNIENLINSFDDLRSQISNKSFDEAFQASINKQIGNLEDLITEQLNNIEDINALCTGNLPDVAEMNTLVKYSIIPSLDALKSNIETQNIEENIEAELKNVKSEIITQFLNVFNQISFIAEEEEILDFIQEKHDELITILSHIVTTGNNLSVVKNDINVVDAKINSLKEDINFINQKINAIISSDDDIDYIYSLQDLENDIANLRLVLNQMKEDNRGEEFAQLISSTNDIYNLVETIKSELPTKENFDNMAEDILSISSRTNKLLLASDESYKSLQDNLQEFKLVINDLDERTRNFADDAGLTKIDSKINALNSMMVSGAKTNQIFNQVFEYLAEWVDNAGVQINEISDRVEALDDIDQIKSMLAEMKEKSEDNSDNIELVEALGAVFDKQIKRISSLETKLDKIIVETTIKDNKLDITPLESTLNKFLVAMDEKVSAQQEKINSLELKLESILSNYDDKATTQLTKKVGGMDRQIAKLNKSIEKIASHVVEK